MEKAKHVALKPLPHLCAGIVRAAYFQYSTWDLYPDEFIVECCCFLLLIIIDEGSGDAPDRFVLLKPALSEAIFKLLLQNERVPDLSFYCWDCFRTTFTHLRAFYKLDVEGDNR